MCYNYEIDDKQLGMEFPDLTGTLYDSTEWDNNPFYSAFTFRKAPVIINLTNSDRVQNPVRVKQHYKGARIPKLNPRPDWFQHPSSILTAAFSAAVRLPNNHQTINSCMGWIFNILKLYTRYAGYISLLQMCNRLYLTGNFQSPI